MQDIIPLNVIGCTHLKSPLIFTDGEQFKLYTTKAVYHISLRDGHLYHNGFVPLDEEALIDGILECSPFNLPFETVLSTGGENFNAAADNRQIDGYTGWRLKYTGHDIIVDRAKHTLSIYSADDETGLTVDQKYTVWENSPGLQRQTLVTNNGIRPVTVEHLSSFALYHFPYDGGTNSLILHRFRSQWTYEGEHVHHTLGELGLTDGFCRNSWRFENVSSFSTREFFPYFILEDTGSALCTAVQIETSAPWRFEIGGSATKPDGRFYMTGGSGNDRYAQLKTELQPGESLDSAPCSLVTVRGGFPDMIDAMHSHRRAALIHRSSGDSVLPVVYNEWQNSYGHITQDTIQDQMASLKAAGIEVYVIDAGWYCPLPEPGCNRYFGWWSRVGDWIINDDRFPNSLSASAEIIRKNGVIPGIWIEPEIAGILSDAYHDPSILMTRNGGFVQSHERRFLNFGDPAVRERIRNVLERLIGYGFGYIKLDFNSDSGPGCDNGNLSPGEGLRRHVIGLYELLDTVREQHPEVIIESCSSGGMRMDYGILTRADMSSITDQEDNRVVGEIYYNVSKIIHPSQSASWSTVKSDFSKEDIARVLMNSILGRMHISGDIQNFTPDKHDLVTEAIALYKSYRYLLDNGKMWHHSADTLYNEHRGVKIIELGGRQAGDPCILWAVGLQDATGKQTVRFQTAVPEVKYQLTRFPRRDPPVCFTGAALCEGFTFNFECDYQSALFVFTPADAL